MENWTLKWREGTRKSKRNEKAWWIGCLGRKQCLRSQNHFNRTTQMDITSLRMQGNAGSKILTLLFLDRKYPLFYTTATMTSSCISNIITGGSIIKERSWF